MSMSITQQSISIHISSDLPFLSSLSVVTIRSGGVFPRLPKLTDLSLSFMPDLTHIGAGAFSNLSALQHLQAQSNPKLSYIDKNAFSHSGSANKFHEVWPPITKVRWQYDLYIRYMTRWLNNGLTQFIFAAHLAHKQFVNAVTRYAGPLGRSGRNRFAFQRLAM